MIVEIIKKLIKYNYTTKPNRKFSFICVHDTDNVDMGANALMHYNYFNEGNKNASADFFVDDKQVIQLIDIDNAYSWAVGDGYGKYGITNANSISVEICINSDGNYNTAVINTIELVAYLMRTYNIPIERVVSHHMASRKICPKSMYDNGKWTGWNKFKRDLANFIAPSNNIVVKSAPPPAPVIEQWQINTMNYLLENKLIPPNQFNANTPVTLALFADIMNAYKYKAGSIDPIPFLTQNGYIKDPHPWNELLNFETFGYIMMNKLGDGNGLDPLVYLQTKRFLKSPKEPNTIITVSVLGAIFMNWTSLGNVMP